MGAVFSDQARLQGMLDFEAALARAECAVGIIPAMAAAPIATRCQAEFFDFSAISAAAALAGNLAIPLVKELATLVARDNEEAARYVHHGATSQDALDTGLVLQLRAALDLFAADLARLADALAHLAEAHAATPLAGRTWLQQAPPVTVGLKAAGWLVAVERHRARLTALRPRLLVVQLGGAVGTLAAFGPRGQEVVGALARLLHLGVPDLPWHTERDCLAELAAALGLLTGTLGKMGRGIALLMQTEVGEAFEPAAPGRGGSSTMPHKRNPVSAAVALAAAVRVPGLVSTMLAAMVQEHERGLGGWHAEWETLPEICMLTAGALGHMADVAAGLEVDAARMRENLARTNGLILAEAVALALAPALGRAAHALVERACRRAVDQGLALRAVLADEPDVTAHLSAADLDRLCDPANYTGLSTQLVARVLASHVSGT